MRSNTVAKFKGPLVLLEDYTGMSDLSPASYMLSRLKNVVDEGNNLNYEIVAKSFADTVDVCTEYISALEEKIKIAEDSDVLCSKCINIKLCGQTTLKGNSCKMRVKFDSECCHHHIKGRDIIRCGYVFKKGKTVGKCCRSVAINNGWCNRHNPEKPSMKKIYDGPTCIAILKSGKNKGNKCGHRATLDDRCKKHRFKSKAVDSNAEHRIKDLEDEDVDSVIETDVEEEELEDEYGVLVDIDLIERVTARYRNNLDSYENIDNAIPHIVAVYRDMNRNDNDLKKAFKKLYNVFIESMQTGYLNNIDDKEKRKNDRLHFRGELDGALRFIVDRDALKNK